MKVTLLTQYFDPEPAFKGLFFAKGLANCGFDVSVVTGFPNYPEGRLYDGYTNGTVVDEFVGGIPVRRVPLWVNHDRSALRRVGNYVSFATSAALFGYEQLRGADAIYVYGTPPTAALGALLARRPFVFDVIDLWPESVTQSGMLRATPAVWGMERALGCIYDGASAVVVPSPGLAGLLTRRGVRASKIETIPNWCDEGRLVRGTFDSAALKALYGIGKRFTVMFAGTMGTAQGLDVVVDAAALLAADAAIEFVLVGGGVEAARLRQLVVDRGLDNVRFVDRVPLERANELLTIADVVLVHLKDEPLFRATTPSKTQAYLAAGRPILMAMRGDAAELVELAGAGLVCAPEDPRALAEMIRRFHAMPRHEREAMGLRGRDYYDKNLSSAVAIQRFSAILRRIDRHR